ncbi:hypothetical protein CXF83_10935 [Shewanella sp. Choline-02u-19]|nr:hypothetical protein CXF84_16250 [Shewanella sp. Bg11-22]PKI27207.1 hypothetical protein CXF83_10935 [Shewanella sp. Choline-02u-19]
MMVAIIIIDMKSQQNRVVKIVKNSNNQHKSLYVIRIYLLLCIISEDIKNNNKEKRIINR